MTSRIYENRTNNVTIEIAPRQSGKTTRLVNMAVDYVMGHAINEAKVMIVTMNLDMSRRIRDMVNAKIESLGISIRVRNQFIIQSCNNIEGVRHSLNNFISNRYHKVFFDEFEFMDEVPFIHGAYYTSTPNQLFGRSKTADLLREMNITEWTETETDFANNYMGLSERVTVDMTTLQGALERADLIGREWDVETFAELSLTDNEEDCYLYRLGMGEPEPEVEPDYDVPF
jgi:hypothetical protein